MADTTLSPRTGVDDEFAWVPEKIGIDHELIVGHVVRQVQSMGLGKDDGFVQILRASMGSQARNAAITGDFSEIVNRNEPIEIGKEIALRANGAGQRDYDHWRDQQERTARQLIDRGMDSLKRFDFSDFWDGKLWNRLIYNSSHNLLMEDGIALLKVVLGDAPEAEHEGLIAVALAERFSEDIVKAEIVDGKRRRIVSPNDNVPIRANERDELQDILLGFSVAAEGNGMKLYADTSPISFSWAEKLLEAVDRGDDELLTDLKRLLPVCKPALEGEDVSREAYEAMAAILAKHFPSIIIAGLTPATEIILRSYQVDR
jgi:hypothetical protein